MMKTVILKNIAMGLPRTVYLTLLHAMDNIVTRVNLSVIMDDVGRLPNNVRI